MTKILKKFMLLTSLILCFAIVVPLASCGKAKEPTVEEILNELKMNNLTVDYDGKEHSIYLLGELPEGATVVYSGNEKKLPGNYKVSAKVTYNGKVKTYTGNLIIKRLKSELSAGKEQTFYITSGTKNPIQYTLNNSEQEIEYVVKQNDAVLSSSYLYKEGTYTVTIYAKESSYYEESEHIDVKLTVKHSQFDVLFEDKTFEADGNKKSIALTGSLPSGYSVFYKDNEATEVGRSFAVAEIRDSQNNTIETHYAILKIEAKDNPEFEKFLDDFFVEYLEGDQLSVNILCEDPTAFGLDRYDAVWYTYKSKSNSISSEDIINEFNEFYAEFNHFPIESLSPRQQIAKQQIDDFMSYRKKYLLLDENIDFIENHYIDQFGGYVADFGTYMEAYSLRSKADVEDIVNYISSTKEAFASYVTYLDDKVKAGYPLSDFTLNSMLDYLDDILVSKEEGSHYYLNDILAAKIDKLDFLSQTEKVSFKNQIEQALDNEFMDGVEALYSGLEKHLGDLKAEDEGYWSTYEKGKDLFLLELEHLLGIQFYSDVYVEEYINELDQAIRRASSLSAVALNEIVSKYNISTYTQLYEFLEKNAIFDGTPEEMLEYLKEFAKTIVPDLNYTPDITIKEMDEASAKVSNAVAYYMKSALDNVKAETITLNPIKLGDKNDVLATLSHEGYPGHLYAYCFSKQLNLHNISKIMTSTAHGEGWATYVELKLYEYAKANTTSSSLKSIIDYLYADHLNGFLFETRIDIGIHYQGWNLEDVSSYLAKMGLNEEAALDIYQLLIETPTSYAAYGYGKLVFYNLHERAKEVLGVFYDEIEFNAMLLSKGWISLGMLKDSCESYLQEKCFKNGIEYSF